MEEEEISNGLYTAVKPFYCVCKILGQESYSYSKAKNNKIKIVRGCVHTTYSIVWAIFFVVALAYTLRSVHNCDYDVLLDKTLIASYIYYIATFAASVVSLIHGAVFSGRKHSQILSRLSLVDSVLFRPGEERGVNRKIMFTSIAEIVIVLMYQLALSFYYISTNTQEACFTNVLLSLECLITYSNITIVLRYCNLVRVMQERFKRINKHLSSYDNVSCIINCVTNGNRMQGHSKCFGDRNAVNLCVSSRNSRSINATEFRSLRITFSELNHVIRLINEDYGISVLAATIWILVTMVLMVFFTLQEAEYGAYSGIGYLFSSLCLLTKLSSSCHTAGSEIGVSKFLVQKLLLDSTFQPKDSEELKMLALQLNSTTTEYSAYGFFILNLQFLCSVIGVIISYIVIIVQIK
ncbi:hypothetical protein B7P43_G15307 [Cryptotermes secundus]|uniref:Gustatory receptor n=1 Tax=Cryptotermes secundus TaxID=105785 RepID=A0A2J7PTQ4_9NEOP|nr:hypothetical protein B7P43_G15307 [Cryptotermes secundus]